VRGLALVTRTRSRYRMALKTTDSISTAGARTGREGPPEQESGSVADGDSQGLAAWTSGPVVRQGKQKDKPHIAAGVFGALAMVAHARRGRIASLTRHRT
jgi:hypothetical protein